MAGGEFLNIGRGIEYFHEEWIVSEIYGYCCETKLPIISLISPNCSAKPDLGHWAVNKEN